jgi:hypothetical protein
MARKRKQSMNAEAAADALPMDVDIDYVDENGENLNQQEIFEVKNGENLDQQESRGRIGSYLSRSFQPD